MLLYSGLSHASLFKSRVVRSRDVHSSARPRITSGVRPINCNICCGKGSQMLVIITTCSSCTSKHIESNHLCGCDKYAFGAIPLVSLY